MGGLGVVGGVHQHTPAWSGARHELVPVYRRRRFGFFLFFFFLLGFILF